MGTIKSYRDLVAYQEAHKLALQVYEITKLFPPDERFALVDQLRRCAISITSNIAEGFARNTTKDKIQFYTISRGSLCELDSQLLIAKDLKYISEQNHLKCLDQINFVSRLLSGLIKTAPSNQF